MIMSSEDFVNALYSGKNLEAEDAFKSAMQDKVGQALEVKRREVANNFVKTKIEAVSYTHLTLPTSRSV